MFKSQAGKVGLAVTALVLAAGIWVLTGGGARDVPTDFFYDLSEQKLYQAPRDGYLPLEGIGGEPGDGVKALVVYCPACGPENRRIAYLKSRTPQYKQTREQARQAGERLEGVTRQWISENTLIRLVDGDEWHKATSPEAIKIVTAWKRFCGQHKQWEKPWIP